MSPSTLSSSAVTHSVHLCRCGDAAVIAQSWSGIRGIDRLLLLLKQAEQEAGRGQLWLFYQWRHSLRE
jgi:hypothetical protein